MNSVFHYTDISGLLGILRNKSLFATDYRYLNDSSEGQIIRELLLPIFESEVASLTPKLIERKWLKREVYDEHGLSSHRLQAESLYSAMIRATNNVSPFFVLSLCRHEESDDVFAHGLLSQWRGYAQGGGFAIEFDEGGLDSLMSEEPRRYCYMGFKSSDVQYDKYQRIFEREKFEGVASEMMWRLFQASGLDVSEVTGRKEVDPVFVEFAQVAPFLKHPGFEEEREYRILGICLRRSKIPDGESRPAKPIMFRQKGSMIIPYIELFSGSKLPIKSIIVGPTFDKDAQTEAVQMVLEQEDLDVPVRQSGIPFRL